MSIFSLENHAIVIDPGLLPIPEFKVLWDRDKDKNKATAYKELCFVYYMADYKSPYNNIEEELREDRVREDYIRDAEWKPDIYVQDAIDKYRLLQETPTMRLLESAKVATAKLASYFREASPEDKQYTSNLDRLGKIVESIDKLEQKVKLEQASDVRIRGGGEVRRRER